MAITAQKWIQQVFSSKIAKRGGHVRRKVSTIDKYASRADLIAEVKRRGYHVVEMKDQWVVICNRGKVKIVV